MREKGTDFSIARTRYTVNKQKFLQHPMVKRISALAEDEQRKGCRPVNEGKAPLGPAQRPTSSDMENTDRAKTVQPWLTKQKSHEIFRIYSSRGRHSYALEPAG